MSVNFKGVIKGSIFSILITLVIIFILSLLSYFTQISETAVTAGVYASVIVGVLAGVIAVSKAAESKVFIHAMLVCLIYMLVLISISLIANGEISFNTHLLAITGGVFCAGFLGSIIGK